MERYLIYGLVAVMLLGVAWGKGYIMGSQRLEDYIGGQAKEATRINTARGKVTEKVVVKYVKVKGATQTVTEYVDREVIKYANTTHCLDAGWGRLHDAAAVNAVPGTPGAPDGKVGAPQADTALKTVTQNYAACHRNADKLDGLQEWVREQLKVK